MLSTREQLEKMTTREIAFEARRFIYSHVEDKELTKQLAVHKEVLNEKMKAFTKLMNKKYGKSKTPPQIRVNSDFLRFK